MKSLKVSQQDIPTLKTSWDQGRNVIVSYDHRASLPPEIWSEIKYYYGNSMDPTKVESKLRQDLEKAVKNSEFYLCSTHSTL